MNRTKAFGDKKGLTFSLLSDGDGAVSKAYGAELTYQSSGSFRTDKRF